MGFQVWVTGGDREIVVDEPLLGGWALWYWRWRWSAHLAWLHTHAVHAGERACGAGRGPHLGERLCVCLADLERIEADMLHLIHSR